MTEVAELDTFVSGPQPEPPAAGAAAKPKLSFGNLAFYGAGSLVENATGPVLALSLFYLSAICGLTGSQAGFVAMLTLVVDSACDPLVGSMSDNSRSRHGRRHPFMLLSLLPIFVAFGLLFSVPLGLSGTALFVYALVDPVRRADRAVVLHRALHGPGGRAVGRLRRALDHRLGARALQPRRRAGDGGA